MTCRLSSVTALEDRVDSNEDVLNLYGEQLGVLEYSIGLLGEEVNVLQTTDVTMEEKLDALEAADMITEQRLDQLEMAVNDTTPDDLSDQVEELENITASMQNNIDDLVIADMAHDYEINALKDIDSGFELRIAQLEQGNNSSNVSIGFHARLYGSDLPSGTPILYDNVLVNIGNRYSPSTGIFRADTAGLYYFEQYWLMRPGYNQNLYIWKSGVQQCMSYGDSYGGSDYGSSSCSAVIELSPGEQVYVTSDQGHSIGCCEYTGFTGFLIKAYE